MGFLKNWLIEQHERGFYWVADKYVCDECVDDSALRQCIRDNAEATTCSYCGRQRGTPIACELDTFLGALAAGIAVDWDDAIEFMPYDGGDWALPDANRTIYDLLADGDLGIEVHEGLFDDIVEAFRDRTFAPRYYFGLGPDERLRFGWDAFVEQVTHQTRYLFLTVEAPRPYASPGEIPPAKMLSELGRVVREAGLVHELAAGSTLYRVRLRQRGKTPPSGAKELGTPPIDRAHISNRMSPSGIAMFYGAFDEATAVEETTSVGWPDGKDLTLAVYRPPVDCRRPNGGPSCTESLRRQQAPTAVLSDLPARIRCGREQADRTGRT